MPPNWSTIAELRAELRGWTMATRNECPLGVEFAAKFGPPAKKEEEKTNKISQKKLTPKSWGRGVGGRICDFHFGRRSVGSPEFFSLNFF